MRLKRTDNTKRIAIRERKASDYHSDKLFVYIAAFLHNKSSEQRLDHNSMM